ncbi:MULTISPECIES: hypothetical protein [unclassified Bradyrhizobium]|uniref:hypothetical protein n=1 Tax=unclassified Bradyrhizobium TaxID=2631580 RepID=UPI002478E38F|nr:MULTISPECIES: hypothetical protein [unclassified Bradyrhizobium]WGS17264.1 hypothetical protein MTX22_21540 [Bradyrhizobium sp. ISRA463]WGS31000.1 hypothetical protein MTX19_19225 [Bradyrhizobium sp. ISRA464]
MTHHFPAPRRMREVRRLTGSAMAASSTRRWLDKVTILKQKAMHWKGLHWSKKGEQKEQNNR